MLTVRLDTSPLQSGHAHRGVGMYTRYLLAALQQRRDVSVQLPGDAEATEPDLIHYPFFDLFFATLPWRRKTPMVVTIHDVIPLKFPQFYRSGLKGRLRWWRQWWAVRKVDAVITDSETSKADIAHHLRIKADKIHVVPLAANPEIQPLRGTRAKALLKEFQLPEHYVLYVGDINYNKNIPQLIKMLKFLPEQLHLVCVGKNFKHQAIPEWRWIEAQVAASNVTERVTFLSEIAPDQTEVLSALYSQAVAYVQPSLYEGFGLPLLEAMQARVPVVSSQVSSLREVAGDHAILVEPTGEALAAGVAQVLDWSSNRRLQVVRAAGLWAQQFSWQKVAAKTAAVYKQVVTTPS